MGRLWSICQMWLMGCLGSHGRVGGAGAGGWRVRGSLAVTLGLAFVATATAWTPAGGAPPPPSPQGAPAATIAVGQGCADEEREAALRTVRRQAAALAARDFAEAMTFTSDRLRARIDLGQFAQVMTFDYGFLTRGAQLTPLRCQVRAPGSIFLEVDCQPGAVVVYHLVAERGGWFVETARTTRVGSVRRAITT